MSKNKGIKSQKTHSKTEKTTTQKEKSSQIDKNSKKNEINTFELNSLYDNSEIISDEKATSKIDYRHYKTYPIKEILPMQKLESEFDKYYWLVTYDKLIKTKKILKILNLKIEINGGDIYTEKNLKIRNIKIKNFEIFFVKGFDKPFVRPQKNSFIFAKMYLLTRNEINKIINYLNRTEGKIDINKFIKKVTFNDNNFCELFDYDNNIHIKNKDISYPYCDLYHVGKFMNISMLLFTNIFNNNTEINSQELNNNKNNRKIIYFLPSSKKLHKLIKLFMKIFPDYNLDYFIDYLLKPNLYKNCDTKKTEITKLFSLLKHSVPNKFLLTKVLRDTITGIQTTSSKSGSSILIESSERINNNPLPNINKISSVNKNVSVGVKNSLKSNNIMFNNGQLITTNYYLSTNHTLMPSTSINTFKNSLKNKGHLTITIPYEINNAKKEKGSLRVGLRPYLTSTNLYNNNNKRISYYVKPKKDKNEGKKITSKKKENMKKNKIGENKSNNDNKENIDINKLINKKNEEGFYINKILNSNDIFGKYKKNEKKGKIVNNSKIYHTPKKRKKYKYYK